MLRAQVAVAVADEAGRRPPRELGTEVTERGTAETGERREPIGAGRRRWRAWRASPDDEGEPVGARVGLHRRGGVEARDRGADGGEVGRGHPAVRQAGEQRRRLVVAVHDDGVLDRTRVGFGRHGQTVRLARHERDQLAIDVRGEAAVEPQLGLAAGAPARERAVVQEREADRLLDLVRRLAGEEHPGDVGLA